MGRKSLGFTHERAYFQGGITTIIGCDEVGRGCLAGPVVAAAIFFDWSKGRELERLRKSVAIADSKTLSPSAREEADVAIREVAKGFSIGIVDVPIIDKINILQASLRAMKEAVQKLPVSEEDSIVLIDGNQKIPHFSFAQKTIIDGDAKLFSIAAASIIAKVYRDNLMKKYHEEYPMYGWDKNMGYGTPFHKKALFAHGLSPHHRKTFCHISPLALG